jgi:hypothetical protein
MQKDFMKIILDEFLIWEVSPTMQKVIQNDIRSDIFQDDMARRLRWVIESKYEACFKRLKEEWDPKLAVRGIESIPTNPEKYAELVFSQTDYKNRSERDIT